MALNIYIGTENNQLIPQLVLEYSILEHSGKPVKIHPIKQKHSRIGGTNFGFARFYVPELNEFEGVAIYLDADQLVFTDIHQLASTLDVANNSIALVNRPEGYFGKKQPGQHNQTSVMVLDCGKLTDWKTDSMFDHVVPNRAELQPGQIHYRDFMSLKWFDQNRIQAISPRWNHFNIVNDNTNLTHFSHVRSQPWKNPKHELTEFWGEWLGRAVGAGAIRKLTLFSEIFKGHVHPNFIRYII